MLKFVSHSMDTIDGVAIYSIISLSIFLVVFIGFFAYAMTYKKETINELSDLPLRD